MATTTSIGLVLVMISVSAMIGDARTCNGGGVFQLKNSTCVYVARKLDYYGGDLGITMRNAQNECQSMNEYPVEWNLPKIDSLAFNEEFHKFVHHFWDGWRFWIGLIRERQGLREDDADWRNMSKWRWISDNSTLQSSFQNETSLQRLFTPRGYGSDDEQCAFFEKGAWDDLSCRHERRIYLVVCEGRQMPTTTTTTSTTTTTPTTTTPTPTSTTATTTPSTPTSTTTSTPTHPPTSTTTQPASKSDDDPPWTWIGAGCGVSVGLIVLVLIIAFIVRRRRKQRQAKMGFKEKEFSAESDESGTYQNVKSKPRKPKDRSPAVDDDKKPALPLSQSAILKLEVRKKLFMRAAKLPVPKKDISTAFMSKLDAKTKSKDEPKTATDQKDEPRKSIDRKDEPKKSSGKDEPKKSIDRKDGDKAKDSKPPVPKSAAIDPQKSPEKPSPKESSPEKPKISCRIGKKK